MRRPVSSLVDEAEDLADAIAQEGLADQKALFKAIGGRPYGKVTLSPDDKRALQVPVYQLFLDDRDYWKDIYDNHSVTVLRNGVPTILKGAGAVHHHSVEMQKLHQKKPGGALPGMGETLTAPVEGVPGRAPMPLVPLAGAVAASPDRTKPLPPVAGSEVL